MLKQICGLLASGVAVVAMTAGGVAGEKWDMPMAYSDSNYHTQNGKLFAAAVTSCTGGELEIVVHGGGSLFKGNEIKRAVQTGVAQLGERLLSAHQNEEVIFGYDSVPFLATSFDASKKLWAAARATMVEKLDAQNLVLLYAVPWPGQGLYFKKEVNSIADTKGVKFRSYNSATARLAELSGMLPVQVEAAELSQALATGVAESFVSSGSTGVDRKVWEHLSHFYAVNAWLPRNYIFVNKDSWASLSDKSRDCLKTEAAIAEKTGTDTAESLAAGYLVTLADNGMKVQDAEGQFLADLKSIGATMTTEWLAKSGDTGMAIVEAYKAQ